MEPETEVDTTTLDADAQPQGIGSIYESAIGENQDTPKAIPETGGVNEKDKADAPFMELLLDEAKKIPFKNEEEFTAFLERNKVLKEGWLRQADYSRKTMDLANQRKDFENRSAEDKKLWGDQAPDPASKQAFANAWKVFQAVDDPIVSENIQKFFQDLNLMAKGQEPVGPLKQGSSSPTNSSPETVNFQREILRLENKLRGFENHISSREREGMERLNAQQAEKAEQEIDEWITGKEKNGSKISGDELLAMSDFMSLMDEKGQPKYTLDKAHELALALSGKTQAAAAKAVLKDAKSMNGKTPRTPISRSSSSEEPEAKSIGEIFSNAAKQMR